MNHHFFLQQALPLQVFFCADLLVTLVAFLGAVAGKAFLVTVACFLGEVEGLQNPPELKPASKTIKRRKLRIFIRVIL